MYLLTLFLPCLLFFCTATTENYRLSLPDADYDFSTPDHIYILPSELDEISGVCFINNEIAACIEDESGTIFIYNFSNKRISNTIQFEKKGDFEDIVKWDSSYYVLRSDGSIYEVSNDGRATKYNTPLSEKNNTEGLCIDKSRKQLLISCKNGARKIFAYDPDKKSLHKKPLFQVELNHFEPTALTFDLNQKYILILSDDQLAVYNSSGELQRLIHLNPSLFKQAEGISMNEHGDLLISNEAQGSEATILLFKNRKAK